MRTTIDINDREYVLSHMKAPRGRGMWAFRIAHTTMPLLWSPTSTYADAKVWARAAVRTMQYVGTIPAGVDHVALMTQP